MKTVIANWKNHPATLEAAKELFAAELKLAEQYADKVKVIICPPAKFLMDLVAVEENSTSEEVAYRKNFFGAQDVFWQVISETFGVKYVLVGHSDQRAADDTDEAVNHKLKIALDSDVVPILLVGEQDKNTNRQAVLEAQLYVGLAGLSAEDMDKVLICYEPVWAISRPSADIDRPAPEVAPAFGNAGTAANEAAGTQFRRSNVGTGKAEVGNNSNLLSPDIALPSFSTKEGGLPENWDTPEGVGSQRKSNIGTGTPDTPADTLRASDLINELLSAKFHVAHPTILYGGSVNAQNVAEFLKHPEISGAVVGAASLQAEEFGSILEEVSKLA